MWGAIAVDLRGERMPFEHAGVVQFEAEQPAELGFGKVETVEDKIA